MGVTGVEAGLDGGGVGRRHAGDRWVQRGGREPGAAGGDGAGPATARTAWTAGTEAAAGVCVWCVLVCVAECG